MINKSGVGATQVRALGSNLVSMGGQAKPLGAGMQMATVGGKQTIVINKPQGSAGQLVTGTGQQIIRTAGGQQIIVMSTADVMKTVQHVTTSQAGAGERIVVKSRQTHLTHSDDKHPCTVHPGQCLGMF